MEKPLKSAKRKTRVWDSKIGPIPRNSMGREIEGRSRPNRRRQIGGARAGFLAAALRERRRAREVGFFLQ
jgi:hypothetical protein